jgi:hypothetical protein
MILQHTVRTRTLETYRGIHGFKMDYQPITNLVKDENGDLLADSHTILNRRKNYFSQQFSVHGVIDVSQMEVHTADPLITETSPFEVKVAIAKLKRYKWPGANQILTNASSRRWNIAF